MERAEEAHKPRFHIVIQFLLLLVIEIMILTAATLRRTEKRLRSEWLLVIRYICNYALADNAAIIYVIMRIDFYFDDADSDYSR